MLTLVAPPPPPPVKAEWQDAGDHRAAGLADQDTSPDLKGQGASPSAGSARIIWLVARARRQGSLERHHARSACAG